MFENDSKCRIGIFQKIVTIFGSFSEPISTQNVKLARFARNVKWDFICDFQTPCWSTKTSGLGNNNNFNSERRTNGQFCKLKYNFEFWRQNYFLKYLYQNLDKKMDPKSIFYILKVCVQYWLWDSSICPSFRMRRIWESFVCLLSSQACVSRSIFHMSLIESEIPENLRYFPPLRVVQYKVEYYA